MAIRHVFAVAVLTAVSSFGADPALLNLIGSDAKVIGGINVDRTISSPFGQYLLAQMKQEDESFTKFIMATGFDPRRDVREILFASAAGEPKSHNALVVARGVFNGSQIAEAAKLHGGTVVQYKGVNLVTNKNGRGDAFAILDGSIAVAGKEQEVMAAIDRRGGSSTPNALAVRANELSGRYDAWAISVAPLNTIPAPGRAGNITRNNAMQAIEEASGGVVFGAVVRVSGEALTRSDKDAQALIDVVKFLAGMAQLNRDNPQAARFEALLNSMELKAEARTVKFSFSFPQSDLEQMLKPRRQATRAAR